MHRFCVWAAVLAATPALASNAFVSVCCTVPSAISVIDRTTHAVTGTLIAGVGAAFVTLTPNSETAYVANENAQSISVLDTATGTQTAAISLSAYNVNPYGAVLSPDGTMLYVLGSIDSSVNLLAIDAASYVVLFDDTVESSGFPGSLRVREGVPMARPSASRAIAVPCRDPGIRLRIFPCRLRPIAS